MEMEKKINKRFEVQEQEIRLKYGTMNYEVEKITFNAKDLDSLEEFKLTVKPIVKSTMKYEINGVMVVEPKNVNLTVESLPDKIKNKEFVGKNINCQIRVFKNKEGEIYYYLLWKDINDFRVEQ